MTLDFSGILLDIEGTTSSISFVYDVMFPYARRELAGYLSQNWDSQDLRQVCELIARDAGKDSLAAWLADTPGSAEALVHDEVIRLMDADVKATGLKQLQGLIWRAGFESGEMKSHLYDDVPPALQRWSAAGIDIRIYSSGSIAAQQLFFRHTIAGDQLHRFQGHYDTTTGPKQDAASYTKIADDFGMKPSDLLFVSDVVDELRAAREAGFKVVLSVRPGNPDPPSDHGYEVVHSFEQIE